MRCSPGNGMLLSYECLIQARTRRIPMSSLRALTVSIALASENTVAGASCPRGFGALNVDIPMLQPCKGFEHLRRSRNTTSQ